MLGSPAHLPSGLGKARSLVALCSMALFQAGFSRACEPGCVMCPAASLEPAAQSVHVLQTSHFSNFCHLTFSPLASFRTFSNQTSTSSVAIFLDGESGIINNVFGNCSVDCFAPFSLVCGAIFFSIFGSLAHLRWTVLD